MKAKFLALAALVLGLASCQTDTVNGVKVDANGEAPVTIQVGLPEEAATRAAFEDSAKGAIDNGIDLENTYDIRYILEVYDANGTLAKEMEKFEDTSIETNFELRLVPGRHYSFVVWADFVNQGSKDALHYIAEDLTDVKLNTESNHNPMDESRDAYTGVFNTMDNNGNVFSGNSSIKITLTRPFAKLRVVSTDMNQLYSNLESATIKYTVPLYTTFDALNATPKNLVDNVEKEVDYSTMVYTNEKEPLKNGTQTLFADYFFGAENDRVMFTMDVNDGVAAIPTVVFNTNIPVQRNYLTTVQGPILTDPNNITVIIDSRFEQPGHVVDIWDGSSKTEVKPTENEETGEMEYVVDSAAELAWLVDLVNGPTTRATAKYDIVLAADIDLNNMPWTSVGTEENNFVGSFDGKGHSIKNLNIEVAEAKEGKAYLGFFGYAKDATIKNVTFENVNINVACLDIDHSQGHIGAVAGSLEGTSTIENVTVKGDIKVESTVTANGASRVAVVAGGNSYGNVTMKEVHVIANEGSYLKANNNVGALAGQLQGKSVFENCSSNIDVTGTKFFAGGIIGLAAGDQTFTNCHTTGDITITAGREGKAHDHYRVGGIAGGWADGAKNVCTLTDCSYTGQLSGTNADGSVAEVFDYAGYVGRGYTLNNCQGSKVVIDGVEYVQAYNTAAEAGIYYVNGELVISTASAFKLFANKVNGGETFADKTVKLGADIDLNNQEWTPIGSAYMDHVFMGNFDGNGYAVKNLKMAELPVDAEGYVYAGLFGVTEGTDKDNQNYIKNLVIENVTIETTGNIVAAAIAYPYYTAIENVTVKGNVSIKGGHYTAGVLAYTRRCVDAKNISIIGNEGSVIEGDITVGGVISDIQMNGGLTANYSNFSATGLTIKATQNVGGISGIICNQTLNGATVKNVTIDCKDDRTGIVAGAEGGKSTIENVVYENVEGATRVIGATYDGSIFVSTADELKAALEAGKGVRFLNDITVAATKGGYNKAGIIQNKAQTIDGDGYTLTVTGAGATWDCAIYTNGGTIKNLTVAGAMRGIFTAGQSSDLNIENVTFKNVIYTFNSDGKMPANPFGVYVSNSAVNGWTSHSNMHTEVVYTNCSFGEGSGYKYCRPYGKTSFVNCTFCAGYTIDQSQTTDITFTNCTFEE